MKSFRQILYFAAAILFGLCACQTVPSKHDTYIGMTRLQVIKRLGFPVHVQMASGDTQGGPGFETWDYYQTREIGEFEQKESGELETVDIVFGNCDRNLGRVVTYNVNINRSRILSQDNPSNLSKILAYDKKLWYPNM